MSHTYHPPSLMLMGENRISSLNVAPLRLDTTVLLRGTEGLAGPSHLMVRVPRAPTAMDTEQVMEKFP